MAKKIRFPLKLAEGAEARTLEELREHFDLQTVLEYYTSGKLLTWLEDRYLEGEAEAIRALDEAAPDFQRRLCEVFQVEYTGAGVDMEEIERRQERLKRLRTVTDEAEYIQNIDSVAFDQEELADLLDEGTTRIYLCGEKFTVPASRKGVVYVGIKDPTVHISGKVPETAENLAIKFTNCSVDNLPKTPVQQELPSETRKQSYCCGELPPELVFRDGVITEHYWLSPTEKDDNGIYRCYRYELATRNQVEIPTELVQAIMECGNSYSRFKDTDPLITVCGDEILWRNFNSETFLILNLASGEMERYHEWGSRIVFNSDYIALYSCRNTFYAAIEVIDRRNPNNRKRLTIKDKDGFPESRGLFLENGLVKQYIQTIERSLIMVGNKLYFFAEQWQKNPNPNIHWLASFDMNTNNLEWVSMVDRFMQKFVAGNKNFIYLDYTPSGLNKIGMLNLRDKSFKTLFEFKSELSDGFQYMHSQEYLVWNAPTIKECKTSPALIISRLLTIQKIPDKIQFNLDGASEPVSSEPEKPSSFFAVELSTGRVKTLSFYPAHKDDGLLPMQVYRSMVYCCQLEEWQKEVGKRTGYKFDLTQNQPQPVEFAF